MRQRPTIVVLAAGQGSRFSAPPTGPAHKLEQGLGASTVLGTTLGHVIGSGCPFVVVTTARLVPLASTLVARRDLVVVSEAEARRGVGHSIAAGSKSFNHQYQQKMISRNFINYSICYGLWTARHFGNKPRTSQAH